MRKTAVAGLGGVGASILGVLCCVGAPVLLALGVSSGFISAFAPLRPLFGILMIAFLGAGFYVVYAKGYRREAQGSDSYAAPHEASSLSSRGLKRERLLLWIATITAILLWSLPSLIAMMGGGDH